MPPGKKAPAQQANLSELWGKKKDSKGGAENGSGSLKSKKGKAPAESEADEPMDEDGPASGELIVYIQVRHDSLT